jgi:hypothetical protein
LHVVRAGRKPVARAVPFKGQTTWFVAGGGWLAWLGQEGNEVEQYMISRDGGETWQAARSPGRHNAGNAARLDPDGTLYTMGDSEAPCGGGGQSRERGRVDGTAWESLPWSIDSPTQWWLGARGWGYGVAGCGADGNVRRLCAIGPQQEDDARPVPGPELKDNQAVVVVSNGRDTLARIDQRLYRLRGGDAELVDRHVPSDVSSLAVDARGRAVALVGGRVVRWAGTEGWRVLMAP